MYCTYLEKCTAPVVYLLNGTHNWTVSIMFQFKGFLQSLVNFSPTQRTEVEGNYRRCVIPPVDVFGNPTTKRDRDLVHLLRLNHHSHSVLYSGYKESPFHNHIPHVSCIFISPQLLEYQIDMLPRHWVLPISGEQMKSNYMTYMNMRVQG